MYDALRRKARIDVAFVDQTDDAALAAACARKPRLILTETPANPTLKLTDVAALPWHEQPERVFD